MVVVGFLLALFPDSVEFAVLDPADLDDAGGSSCRVALDFCALDVLGEEVLKPGGRSAVSSCTAVLDVNHLTHQ